MSKLSQPLASDGQFAAPRVVLLTAQQLDAAAVAAAEIRAMLRRNTARSVSPSPEIPHR